MADDEKPRGYDQFVVEDKGKAVSAFDKARQLQQDKPKESMQAQKGSEQVKQSAPGMQPKPPSHVRNGPDRQAHNERLANDGKTRAQQLKDGIEQRKTQDVQKQQQKEQSGKEM